MPFDYVTGGVFGEIRLERAEDFIERMSRLGTNQQCRLPSLKSREDAGD
jgi:hypothetical protein